MISSANIMEIFSSIQGEGLLVGERQLFIRFYGCNLSCAYCDTEASKGSVGDCLVERSPGQRDFESRPNPMSGQELVDIIRHSVEDRTLHHSVVLTGGEPLLHTSMLEEILPAIREMIPVMLETNGTLVHEMENVAPWIEQVSMDIKIPSSTGEKPDWEAHRRFLMACTGMNLYVKAVVTPHIGDEELRHLCGLIESANPSIPLVLQPVHGSEGDFEQGYGLLEIQAFCKKYLHSVRWIPQVHKIFKIP